MISKVMIKFRSKFQFQIPLQFYRTVGKVETLMVVVKGFDKCDHLFSLPILVTIFIFMIEVQAKHFTVSFLNYFIQPSPQLKLLHGVLRDQLPP